MPSKKKNGSQARKGKNNREKKVVTGNEQWEERGTEGDKELWDGRTGLSNRQIRAQQGKGEPELTQNRIRETGREKASGRQI